jgi:hypothetical protein
VIATDLGAYRERNENETQLFPAGDSARLAAILRSYIDNPGSLAALRARTKPPAKFDRYISDMELIYARAISEGPRPPADDRFDEAAHPSISQFAAREAQFRKQLSGG